METRSTGTGSDRRPCWVVVQTWAGTDLSTPNLVVIWVVRPALGHGSWTFSPLILDQNYVNTKNQVIKAERRILKELGFCVHVKHPHKIIVMYLQVLECHKNQKLVQCACSGG